MARRRSITLDQESRVLSLYKDGIAIKEIIRETGVRSEQTIYRILDSNGVPRRPKVRGVRKIFVTIEEDVAAILDKEQSVSLYVNEAIRFYHSNRQLMPVIFLLKLYLKSRFESCCLDKLKSYHFAIP